MTISKQLQAAATFALLLGLSGAARAAELFYMDHDAFTHEYVGAVGPLVISGDIESGDFDRLVERIAQDEPRFLAGNKIILASEAGDVAEAVKIAVLVKSLYSAVSVGPLTGKCAGACFLIYAAANERVTDGEHLLGVYRLIGAGPFPADYGVPDFLAQEMGRHDSTQPYWLSAADERALGPRSPAFVRYLKSRCAWDAAVEREVYTGKKPFSELAPSLACRARVTRADAREALAAALKEKASRGKGAGAVKN